nr:hypothetical protein [Streptomyces sp. 8L]
MGEHERVRVGAGSALVDEVDVGFVDVSGELRQGVQLGLSGSPIEAVLPVVRQPLEEGQVRSVFPVQGVST